jgi:hypothetical protein
MSIKVSVSGFGLCCEDLSLLAMLLSLLNLFWKPETVERDMQQEGDATGMCPILMVMSFHLEPGLGSLSSNVCLDWEDSRHCELSWV